MKNNSLFRFLFLFLILLFPLCVNAENCNNSSIKINDIILEEKSEEVDELNLPEIDNNIIILDLKMKELGDYVKYKVTITNETDENYKFNPNSLVTNSDYIQYLFDIGDSKLIKPHQTIDIFMIVKYKEKISASSFENGVFHEEKSIITNLNEVHLINPETGSSIIVFLLLIIFIGFSIYLNINGNKNYKSINIGILLLGLLIPIKVYSLCSYEIKVVSNIEIEEYKGRSVYNMIDDESLLDSISSKYVSSSTGIDFKMPSSDTNGKGIYIRKGTEDDKYPIYYYRGDINNNNVLFSGKCWKILRTTSTGGVKLIYNGISNNGVCNNSGDDTLISSGVKWNKSGNLSYFGYAYENGHSYKNKKITAIPNGAIFSEDVSYENGKYILNSNRYLKDDSLTDTVEDVLSSHHYSCFKTDDQECTTINYVYMTRGGYLYYIVLENGDIIDSALEKDLLNSPNTIDSNIKTVIENWYNDNLLGATDLLEDEVWCNDRSIGSYGAWNKNGNLSEKISFGGLTRVMNGTPNLKCPNNNDKFTTSEENGNGLAHYPIGLITLDEAMLAGFAWNVDDDTNYLYNGKVWWTMSPTLVSVQLGYIGVLHSMADNVTTVYVSGGAGGVRPSISLNHSARIKDGNGSVENPFTILNDNG